MTSGSQNDLTPDRNNALFWLTTPPRKGLAQSGSVRVRSPRDLPDEYLPGEAEKERHRIYAGMLMALVCHFWNGNRFGVRLKYPLNPVADPADGVGEYFADTYLGHNIAAIAVDHRGSIIDFEFNHNAAFASSAEHAENRLIRRLFQIANSISGSWEISKPVKLRPGIRPNSHKLNLVTIYTSLESCAQCSGSMAAGSVKRVVYLHPDHGAYLIGNVMYHLATTGRIKTGNPISWSPLPIAGDQIDFAPFDKLDAAYEAFTIRPSDQQFCPEIENAHAEQPPPQDKSLSSFLCTDGAWQIYKAEADEFTRRGKFAQELKHPRQALQHADELGIQHPDWPKTDKFPKCFPPSMLTNFECLVAAYEFLQRAKERGQRGIARGG